MRTIRFSSSRGGTLRPNDGLLPVVTPSVARKTADFYAACPLTVAGCGLFRPSVDVVGTELSRLIDPALDVGLGDAERPDGNAGGGYCHEPLIGPANGIWPTLGYTFSFSILEVEPEVFLERVEAHWRGEGFDVEVQETDNARYVYSGNDGYSISAVILYDSMEADIGGSGPCVDDPNAYQARPPVREHGGRHSVLVQARSGA